MRAADVSLGQRFSLGTLLALTAAGALVACGAALAEVAAPETTPAGGAGAAPWTGFTDWIAASYEQAPALVLGLVLLVAVPPLAIAGFIARRREAQSVDVAQARTRLRRVRASAAAPRDGVRTGHIPLRPLDAWIDLENAEEVAPLAAKRRFGLAWTLLRIGRETDNDICLEDITVHRYHAAVHRTEDAEFVITDLSSAGGNGVVVNGRAVTEARLANGDIIELGNARLKFSAGLPAG